MSKPLATLLLALVAAAPAVDTTDTATNAEFTVEGQAVPATKRSHVYSNLAKDLSQMQAWELARAPAQLATARINLAGVVDGPSFAMALRWPIMHAEANGVSPAEGWRWYLGSYTPGTLLTWDIETLNTDHRFFDWDTVESEQRKLIAVARATRAVAPERAVGFYGVMPNRDFWNVVDVHNAALKLIEANGGKIVDRSDPIHVNTARSIVAKMTDATPNNVRHLGNIFAIKDKPYQAWQRANARLRYGREDGQWTGGLAAEVDYVAPNLYVFSPGPEGNAVYARHNLAEAERYGKRVVVFLWMTGHNKSVLAGQTLTPADWYAVASPVFRAGHDVILWDDGSTVYNDATYRLLAMTFALREQPMLSFDDALALADATMGELRQQTEIKQ